MTRIERVPEYRFVIPGKAESFRSPNAMAYRNRLREIAARLFPAPDASVRVVIWLDYFHSEERRFDMDNVAKCVLDALTGLAYDDDKQVIEQLSQAHDIRHVVRLPGGPLDLVKPLVELDTYLFVRVRFTPLHSLDQVA